MTQALYAHMNNNNKKIVCLQNTKYSICVIQATFNKSPEAFLEGGNRQFVEQDFYWVFTGHMY
jgi:hypothetical protein